MSDLVPRETWTVDSIEFPDREAAFSAARKWATEQDVSKEVFCQHAPSGTIEGWRVRPGEQSERAGQNLPGGASASLNPGLANPADDSPPLPNERWTVEVDFPDRESAFAAARRWADERGDTAVAWCYPTWFGPFDADGDGNEQVGWRVKPGTPSVADVIAGRADLPPRFIGLAQLLAIATPEELVGLRARVESVRGAEKAAVEWQAAESCVSLFRYPIDTAEDRQDAADAEAALAEGEAKPAEQLWAELGLDDTATTNGATP